MNKNSMTRINLTALILAVLLGFYLFFAIPLLTNLMLRHVREKGIETVGTVVAKETSQKKIVERDAEGKYRVSLTTEKSKSKYGTIYYQYRDHNRKLRTGKASLDKELFGSYSVNDIIPVVYLKGIPFLSWIEPNLRKFGPGVIKKSETPQLKAEIKETVFLLSKDAKNQALWEKLAKLYSDAGRYGDCIKEYGLLINQDPKNAHFYADRGYCYGLAEDYENAALSYSKAGELEPDNPKYFYNMGGSYEKVGQWEKAKVAYEKAVALKPEYKDAVLRLGIVLDHLGKYEEGIRRLEAYLAYDRKSVETYYLLSRLAARIENSELVLRYVKMGLEMAPDDPHLNYDLGSFYAQTGKLELAEQQQKILTKLNINMAKELEEFIKHTKRGESSTRSSPSAT